MKTKREHLSAKICERGNVLIYVLIAVALFAALGFAISKQTKTASHHELSRAESEMYATQIIGYAAQVRSVIEQMEITGTSVAEIDFIAPDEPGFNTPPHIHKIYHPEGGGLNQAILEKKVKAEISSINPAGWYLGRVNNVEWTTSVADDAILTAHQISYSVCKLLNEKIMGTDNIPQLSRSIHSFLLDSSDNRDFTIADCAACEGYSSLCVINASGDAYAFYTIVGDQ